MSFDHSTGSSGTANTGLKTLVITGSYGVTADLDMNGSNTSYASQATTVTSVDASGLTAQAAGTNTFTLKDTTGGHALTTSTITGSAGDDLISLGGSTGTDTLASGKVVTISLGAGNDAVTASLGQLYTSGSGYLVLDGGSSTSAAGDLLTISDTSAGTINDNVFAHTTNFESLTLGDTGTLNLTTGGFFNSAFSTGVTVTAASVGDAASTLDFSMYTSGSVKLSLTTGAVTSNATSIVGSAQADTITVTAASYTGYAGAVSVNGGAGNDTITVTTAATGVSGAVVITGGTGADTIKVTSGVASLYNTVTYSIAKGDSTTTAYDNITGYVMADGTNFADKLDLSGTATVASNVATTSYATGITYSITSGIVTFGGTGASSMSVADKITALQSIVLTTLDTVAFLDTSNPSSTNTYVFHHDVSGSASSDTVVELVGTTAALLTATASTYTAGAVYVI